jgi:hypothetical protein
MRPIGILVAALATGLVLVMSQPPQRANAKDDPLAAASREIARQRQGLADTLALMDERPEIFPAKDAESTRLLTPDDRTDALSIWGSFADRLLALEQIVSRAGELSDGAHFALERAGFLARYRFAMEFISRVERAPGLDPLFNEEHRALGLPARSYARLKFHYLNVARATEYSAIELLHHTRRRDLPPVLGPGAREDSLRILSLGAGEGPRMTAANALKVVEDAALFAWMPAQERVARWMGEVRVYRQGEALVSPDQIHALPDELEPGDVLLQRREWYLTNAGIPGFWTHAALYIGTAEERAAFFDDGDTRSWLETLGASNFEAALAMHVPEHHARSAGTEAGHPVRVLEAIAEGVTFTSLEHSAAADSLAVLRARLTKRERAIALLRAFGYAGRPYDYNFDFATDSALVCSELVFKSFQPGDGMRGLELPLERVAGRLMMTPNEMARRFAETRRDRKRAFDFVLMLDGDEKIGRAARASEQIFARSWRRPKWHIITSRGSKPAKLGP